jgi:hypothetical protein
MMQHIPSSLVHVPFKITHKIIIGVVTTNARIRTSISRQHSSSYHISSLEREKELLNRYLFPKTLKEMYMCKNSTI